MGNISDALEKSEKEKVHSGHIGSSLSAIGVVKEPELKQGKTVKKIANNRVKTTKKLAPDLITLSQPHSFEAEQFRTLKTNLLFSSDRKTPRIIMVTSAVPDEGKSFVAANLAVTFAQSVDEHVLLMDCDLRLPTVHKVFGYPDNCPGLSDILAGRCDVPSALHKTTVDKLSIIPGGKIPENPTDLLSSARMKDLLVEVESRYHDRYIIIDSPPPRLTAETIAISRQVDGILVVIKHECTRRNDVKEMMDLLDKDKILGVIVNRYDVRLAKYYGYGKYGYGTYYGKAMDNP